MTGQAIKRGTAARLGLRRPIRGLLMFPSSLSEEQVEQFKAWFNATWPTGHRYVYLSDDEGAAIPDEPHIPKRLWSVLLVIGLVWSYVTLGWLFLCVTLGWSVTPPALVLPVGAALCGLGVFGPAVEMRRHRKALWEPEAARRGTIRMEDT